MLCHSWCLIIIGVTVVALQVVGTDRRGHVPINVSVPVETDTFVGRMRSSIRGCPGTSEAEFRGTKLLGSSIIQVRAGLTADLIMLTYKFWPTVWPRWRLVNFWVASWHCRGCSRSLWQHKTSG